MNEKPIEENKVSACVDCGHKEDEVMESCTRCKSTNIATTTHTRFQGGGMRASRGHIVSQANFTDDSV